MDLFELWATLGIDTGGFINGITGALQWALRAVTDFARDVLETGMGFDKEMSAVQAVLGSVEGTEENMIRLREFALDQARDSIFTAEQTAEAYYYMGMAGWKTEQMLAGLPGVMALAAASGEDLGMVSDIVTDSLTAFGLSAEDATHFVDILAQAATNSNTDVKRMGETFKYIAPIAGSLGIEVEDVALAIGLLASQGIKGSMAGTALRNILTRLSTNAGATEKDFGALDILTEKLGVSFYDTSGNVRDFSDIIREARVAWKGLTEAEQIYYSKQIGSQRGMAAWLALMNAAEEDVDKLALAFENAEGAAQGMADVKLDNLWGDIQMFNSSLDVLKVALFDDVKSPLRDVVQYATDALDRIRDKVEEDGLIGGIRQLGTEINDFTENYKDEIHELAKVVGQLLEVAFEELLPSLSGLAVQLGSSFVSGILDGIYTGYGDSKFGFLRSIANFLGYGGRTPIFGTMPEGASSDEVYEASLRGIISEIVLPETVNYGGVEIPLSEILKVDVDQLSKNIETSINDYGGLDVEIGDGWILSVEAAQKLRDDLINGVFDPAGTDGGKEMAENVGTELSLYTPTITGDLAAKLSGIGPDVGKNLANDIDDKLSQYNFRINVRANVNGSSRSNGSNSLFTATSNEYTVDSNSQSNSGRPLIIQVDGKEIARTFLPYMNYEQNRVGASIVRGGVV